MNIGLKLKVLLRTIFLYMQIAVDKVRGVDFSIPMYHDNSMESQEGTMSSTPIIHPIIKRFLKNERITEDDAIIDVGCGKGRMVYLFSNFPLERLQAWSIQKKCMRLL